MSRNRPTFTVSANGQAVAVEATWACRIDDQVGIEADRCELTIDGSTRYEWPRIGAELEISMGYADDGQALDVMGKYIVDQAKLTGLPWSLTVTGHAGPVATLLSECRARAWVDLTLEQIANDIANTANVPVRVYEPLRAIQFGWVEQCEESDLDVLTRLARRLDVVARVLDGALVIAPRGKAKSVTGQALDTITLTRDAFLSCDMTEKARDDVGAIVTKLRPLSAGRDVSIVGPGPPRWVTFGEGKPRVRLKKVFLNRQQAEDAANAYRRAQRANLWTLQGSVVGDTRIAAEVALTTPDLHPDAPTDWTVTKVTHAIDAGGYVTDFEAESTVQV